MRITFDPDLYNLEDGRKLAIFKGVQPYVNARQADQGKDTYGPGLRWEFEIVGGSDNGKPAGVITAKHPTPKNSCIRILAGIIGRKPAEKEPIDTDTYIGKYYMI